MRNNMHIFYDKEGDLLEIRVGKATRGYFKDLGNDIFERIDEKTGKAKGFAIFNFRKRTERLNDIKIPLPVKIQLSS